MCGILGGFHPAASKAVIEAQLQKIRYRGPDDEGIFQQDEHFLAACRLSIRDLSNKGHQPMVSPDGRYVLVFNGELYNNAELRQALSKEGFEFRSESDTETVLYAWMAWKENCLPRLNGIFAFAVFDTVEKELFVARDALGVKPLYYYYDRNSFIFSSEIKAIKGFPDLDLSLEPEAFYNYLLLLWSPSAQTPFKKVRKLMPGHFVKIKAGTEPVVTQWYRLPFNSEYEALPEKEWTRRLEQQLLSSVEKQLVSDAPVGFFLSGGLDSSLLAAMAAKQSGEALKCFTIDTAGLMAGEGFEDDLPYAKLVAKHCGLDLEVVDGRFNIQSEFDKMIWHLDEPQGDPAALHVWHISRAAHQQGIKVLLNGTGADDVFTGYRRHQALGFLWSISGPNGIRLGPLAPLIKWMAGLKSSATKRRIEKLFANPGKTYDQKMIAQFFWQNPIVAMELFSKSLQPSLIDRDPYKDFYPVLKEISEEKSIVNTALALELRTFLPHHNLNYTDKMSMAASIEARVPYLDTDLIALSARIPPTLKMKGSKTKYLLRKVAEDYLPAEVINRSKTGFGAPVRHWINHDMKEMVADRLLSSTFTSNGFFDRSAIETLIKETRENKRDGHYIIFTLLAIESWLRQFAEA